MAFLLEEPGEARFLRPDEGGAVRDPASFGEIWDAARDSATYVSNSFARRNAIEKAIDDRIAEIRDATGRQLKNPLYSTGREAASLRRLLAGTDDVEWSEVAARAFDGVVSGLADELQGEGGRAHWSRPVIEDARVISRNAAKRMADIYEANSFASTLLPSFIGGVVALPTDPLQVAGLAVNPMQGVGRAALTRIVTAGLGWAGANAATEAALQPFIQDWRREIGIPSGLGEALHDIGMAGVVGFGLGATGRTGLEGFRAWRGAPAAPGGALDGATPPPARGVADTSEAAPAPLHGPAKAIPEEDLIAVAEKHRDKLGAEVRGALDELQRERAIEASRPPGIPPEAHREALERATAFLEDPVHSPPPVGVDPLPAAPRGVSGGEVKPVQLGEVGRAMGKPYQGERISATDLSFQPDVMQYKRGGDARGVTERLAGVARWDPLAAGQIFVFEYANGVKVVADGHQRTGLAQRLVREQRETRVDMDAITFREADGWTPGEVRSLAAKRNIQQETGDVIDTATILREAPGIIDDTMSLSRDHLRIARALGRLSPDAFAAVRAGVIKPEVAAAIGDHARREPFLHMGLVEALAKRDVRDPDVAAIAVRDATRMGAARAEQAAQGVLFDEALFDRTLVIERATILDAALVRLAGEASLFKRLGMKADEIEAVGNVLKNADNAQRAALAAEARDVLTILATRDGALSDILDAAAKELSAGAPKKAVTEKFTKALLAAMEEKGAIRLATEDAAAAIDDAPQTPRGAGELAEVDILDRATIAAERPAGMADLFGDMLDQVPLEDGRIVTAAEAIDIGKRHELVAKTLQGCIGGASQA